MAMRQCYPNGSMTSYNQEEYYEEERSSYNTYGANRPSGGYNAGMGNSYSNHGGYGKPHGVSSYPGSNSYNTYGGGQSLGYGNATSMNSSQNGLGYGNMGTTLTNSQNGQHVGHQAHKHAASGGYMGGYRGTTLTTKNRYRRQGKAHSCNHSADDSCSSDSSGSDSDNEHHGRRRSYC